MGRREGRFVAVTASRDSSKSREPLQIRQCLSAWLGSALGKHVLPKKRRVYRFNGLLDIFRYSRVHSKPAMRIAELVDDHAIAYLTCQTRISSHVFTDLEITIFLQIHSSTTTTSLWFAVAYFRYGRLE